MDESNLESEDAAAASELPNPNDIKAVVGFYERIGAMPIHSIGRPIDRPIIPSQRPDRVGDFDFSVGSGTVPSVSSAPAERDPEAKQVRQEFFDYLDEQLKRP